MNFLFIFCLLFLLQNFKFKCDGAIALNYRLYKNSYYMEISADKLCKDEYTLIDLQNPYSFLKYPDSMSNLTNNNNSDIENVYNNRLNINIKVISTSANFSVKTDIKKYPFEFEYYRMVNPPLYYMDTIGLGKNYTKESHSFIHTLKMNNIINRLTMMFSPEEGSKGKIYIGDYDSDVAVSNKKFKGNTFKCSSGEKWGCLISKIEIGNLTVLSEPTYFLFSTVHTGMIVPNEMMEYLNRTYFAKYIQSGDCRLNWGSTEKYFSCYCSVVYNFPDIYFYINGYKVKFNPKYYFYYFFDTCYLNFVGEVGDDNNYVLGAIFLQSFYYELNYENNEVKFYTDMPVIKNSMDSIPKTNIINDKKNKDEEKSTFRNDYKKYKCFIIIIINSLVMVLGLFYLLILKKDNEL